MAQLKRAAQWMNVTGCICFHGGDAVAQLKRGERIGQKVGAMAEFPRRRRRGSIEAICPKGVNEMFLQGFHGGDAVAQLKRVAQVRAAQVRAAQVSTAETPWLN